MKRALILFFMVLTIAAFFYTVTVYKVLNFVVHTESTFPFTPEELHANLTNDHIDWTTAPKGFYKYSIAMRNNNWDTLAIDYYHIAEDTVWTDSVSYTINYSIDTNTIDSTQYWGYNRTIGMLNTLLDTLGNFNMMVRAKNDSTKLLLSQAKVL